MSNFPSWALQHRKPGTELRRIKGHYYLYSVSSRWDKEAKKNRKVTGPIIGKISPDGQLTPSIKRSEKSKGIAKNPLEFVKNIVIKEFGLSNFFLSYIEDICKQLQSCFPDHWQYIIAVAYCRLFKQAPINQMPFHIYILIYRRC
jgi:hypothetical protein